VVNEDATSTQSGHITSHVMQCRARRHSTTANRGVTMMRRA
jgi:hypothetical protein